MINLTNPTRSNGITAPTTVRRAPFAEMLGLDPLDLFRNFTSPVGLDASVAHGFTISRSENGYVVEMPVPGYKPDHIEITYKDSVLSLSGKNERRTFTRSLVLPEEIDPDHVQAHVEDGLLTLTLNRRPEAEPKRIQISNQRSAQN